MLRPLLRFLKSATGTAVVTWMACSALADDGDDTLRYYLSKSELVVAGEVQTEPLEISSEAGVVDYIFEFKVVDVLQGNAHDGGQRHVNVSHFELLAGDELSWLRKGAKAILFLRQGGQGERRGWISADMWFGAQPQNHIMAQSVKRLAAEEQVNKAPVIEGVVLARNGKVVEISLGTDDAIKAGQELYWHRGGVYLGRLTVNSVTADKATVELDSRIFHKAGSPKRNDQVSTRLLRPR